MTDTTQQEREASERALFESHWYNFYHSGSISARRDGRYMHPAVQTAWEAWQAARATPQGAEPVAWQERQQTADGWTNWYATSEKTSSRGLSEVIGGIEYQWRPLYTHPPEPKLSELQADAKRLDWLLFCVSGREFRRIGVNFSASADRKAIDAAIDAELARQEGSAT